MKLSQVLNYINQALNYPSITYDDVSLFFDSAITELNSSLHIKLPIVSTMINEFLQYVSKEIPNRVLLSKYPEDTDVIPTYENKAAALVKNAKYAFITSENKYGILNTIKIVNTIKKDYALYDSLYAVYSNAGVPTYFKALKFSQNEAIWVRDEDSALINFDFSTYLPDAWVILWLIPYVCFKYTVRDGGTAASFAEDLTQGFQQLQNAYDIPSTTSLITVAGLPAYHTITSENINNLNIEVPTRAIYEHMQHARSLNAKFGSMYDRGGFMYD